MPQHRKLHAEDLDTRQSRTCTFGIAPCADNAVCDREAAVERGAPVAPVDADAEGKRIAVTVGGFGRYDVEPRHFKRFPLLHVRPAGSARCRAESYAEAFRRRVPADTRTFFAFVA